nr:hypothetical protein [Tanacetum cinerariifolium]
MSLKKIQKSPADPNLCSNKKADSSTEQLLFTLKEEVKGLKRQIEIPAGTPSSSSQSSSSKASKQKTWFRPCKHCGFRNHLYNDCYSKPKCSPCGSSDHLTKEHLEHAAIKKTLNDEGSTKIRAFMAIIEDEPSVGKADARSGQWVDITMKKGDESSSVLTPEITSDSEFQCDSQEPLPPLLKLMGATPYGTSERVISLPSVKVSPAYVIKKIPKYPADPNICSDKKVDSSTEQLLFTLTEEVKALKRQIEIPSGTPSSSLQSSSSKASKQKTWFRPCKHYGFRNHLYDDCYSKPKCSPCGSTDHLTKEHLEHAVVKKTLSKLKAQSPLKPSLKKAPMIPKPFIECKYYGFNDHHSDHCEFYPGYEVCSCISHEASDYPKKHPNYRRPRIANRQLEPTKKWVHKMN